MHLKNFPALSGSSSLIMVKLNATRQIFAVFLSCLVTGCHRNNGPNSATESSNPQPVVLKIAAASDLQPWLAEAVAEWGKKQRPLVQTETIFGASGQIAAQIRAGAPLDLFLSADITIVEKLETEGLALKSSSRVYALGRLAMVFPKSLQINSLNDLNQPLVRHLAIANPQTAPYGRASREALQQAGLWQALEGRVVQAESVRQALQQVLSGNADSGLVSLGQAREAIAKNPDFQLAEVPETSHPPIRQGLAVIAHPDQSDKMLTGARALADWLTNRANNTLFEAHGLGRP